MHTLEKCMHNFHDNRHNVEYNRVGMSIIHVLHIDHYSAGLYREIRALVNVCTVTTRPQITAA